MEAQPYVVETPPSLVDSPKHRALALRAAHEAMIMTLLKNNNKLLPLQKGLKLAFIGPHANATQAMLSNYHGVNELVDEHSPLQAATARGLEVIYARGCNICDIVPVGFPNIPCPPGRATDKTGFDEASQAAAAADVAVVFVGSDQTTEAENFDRDTLTLPGVQEELLKRVLAANPRTVVVLINGGAISSQWMVANVPAVLEAYYPGELGGDAIVDTLLGHNNPAGKLPYTVYHSNFTTRDIRDVDLSHDGGVTHAYFTGPVLFKFGHGLSYTTFEYKLEAPSWAWHTHAAATGPLNTSRTDSRLHFSVTARNTGDRAGDCVLLCFLRCRDPAFPLQVRAPPVLISHLQKPNYTSPFSHHHSHTHTSSSFTHLCSV